jgi:serine/threonine protein kinase
MLKPGDTFERYTVDALLGQGGMGHVYRAHDTRLERRVALKVISEGSTSPESNARLLREAKAAAALDHPNAVAIFDVGDAEGTPYIVMELVSGETMRSSIGAPGTPMDTQIARLTDVARVLAAAHKRGLVHRDIKPENVMVRDDGLVKVLDFGIARRAGGAVDPAGPTQAPALPTLTVKGDRLGTPLYMSPEQIKGDALDGRADQFAWGVLAFELLTGSLPWRGGDDALAVVASILTDDPSARALDDAGVPTRVKKVILRALEKRAADRFATMDELVLALEGKEASEAAAPSVSAPVKEPARAASAASGSSAAKVSTTTAAQRYSTQEVKAILERAVEKQEQERKQGGRLGFDDLVAAAAEVGVDAAALREASRELRVKVDEQGLLDGDAEARAIWLRRKRRGFFRHFGVYLIVSAAFAILGLATGGFPDTLMPSLFWGIGVAIHALTTFTAGEDDWVDHREKKRRIEEKRRRREEKVSRVIEEGASLLLSTGRTLQKRIADAPGSPARVRIAKDSGRLEAEAAAEAEAEAERSAEQSRKRR